MGLFTMLIVLYEVILVAVSDPPEPGAEGGTSDSCFS